MEITGTIPGVTGYTVAELRDIWNGMVADPDWEPDDWELNARRLACMAVGLANQLARRKPGREHPGVGVAAVIVRDGKLLMLQRQGAHGEGSWSVPGGWMEHGEDWHAAVEREVLEETGVRVKAWGSPKVTFDDFPDDGIHCVTLFSWAIHLDGEPEIKEPAKAKAVEWVPLSEVCDRELFLPLRTFMQGLGLPDP